ncbi:ribosome maturation factor RimM [Desulfuromonas sp. AOP6]|uniref:ribosome maturation factor RimM n=1 Tax=Desulfuromonas sp. AOP6 TaxID=1566351 RepID=UPI00126CEDF6|nr:ribosome maturation factor RimM [Desulfuromonas sp. AOP6]BCA80548.1 ribosome maturation factor RimM [Desulfuromonas sp. AOP6]
MPKIDKEFLLVGTVAGTHGLRGDLKVRPLAGLCPLSADKMVLLRVADREPEAHIPARVASHKGGYLLRLQGLEHIDSVQRLIGAEVLMRRQDVPEPEPDEFYWGEVQGFVVRDVSLGELGTLDDTFSTAAHDIFVVNGSYGEVLIPVVEAFLVEVDRVQKCIVVDLPEGLVQKSDAL